MENYSPSSAPRTSKPCLPGVLGFLSTQNLTASLDMMSWSSHPLPGGVALWFLGKFIQILLTLEPEAFLEIEVRVPNFSQWRLAALSIPLQSEKMLDSSGLLPRAQPLPGPIQAEAKSFLLSALLRCSLTYPFYLFMHTNLKNYLL